MERYNTDPTLPEPITERHLLTGDDYAEVTYTTSVTRAPNSGAVWDDAVKITATLSLPANGPNGCLLTSLRADINVFGCVLDLQWGTSGFENPSRRCKRDAFSATTRSEALAKARKTVEEAVEKVRDVAISREDRLRKRLTDLTLALAR